MAWGGHWIDQIWITEGEPLVTKWLTREERQLGIWTQVKARQQKADPTKGQKSSVYPTKEVGRGRSLFNRFRKFLPLNRWTWNVGYKLRYNCFIQKPTWLLHGSKMLTKARAERERGRRWVHSAHIIWWRCIPESRIQKVDPKITQDTWQRLLQVCAKRIHWECKVRHSHAVGRCICKYMSHNVLLSHARMGDLWSFWRYF